MLQEERRRHLQARREGPHKILDTYSAILSDTHVFQDKGLLSHPAIYPQGDLWCNKQCFMLETIYFSLDQWSRLSNAISSKLKFSLFLPLFPRNHATHDWLCWQLLFPPSPAQPQNNTATVPSPSLLAAYSAMF